MKWISECEIWALTLFFSFLALTSYGQSFTEVAATVNAQIGTGSKDGGQSWADFNQDGFLDLLVNTNNGTSDSRLLYWNSGTGQYDDVTATHAPGLLLNTLERSALAGDFDNDGDMDFMRSRASRLEIYQNQGPLGSPAYSFVLIQVVDPAWFTGLGTQGGMNNEGLAWMDFDGDGDLDVYMEDHQYGQDILQNDGTGVFTHYTPNSDPKGFPTTGTSGDYSVTADLDNNGDVDIVARRQGTSAALDEVDIFMNNSDGTFTANNTLNLDTRNGFKGGVAVADFDLDGDFDYFWTNNGTASGNVTHVIAEQTGLNSGTFALATVTITPAPSWTGQEIEGIAMGDVNNDGKIDIFLAPDSGPGYLLINTTTGGTFSFSHSNSGINLAADGEGAAMGDYDNDGDLDIYVNIRNGNNQLWENDLGGNTDYLKVEPLIDLGGGISRSATGATAVLELKGCTNLRFIQEISGGVGHGSQNDARLHFGLPDGPNVQYKLTVSFVRPNGGGRTVVEKYVTPSAEPNQTIQILDTDVSDPNAHPTPTNDSFTVARNSSNNSLDVSANDTDPNAEDLTISLLSGTTTQGGTVAVNDNGSPVDPTDDFIEYTPPAAFSGVDNFTYHVTNQSGFCSSADVTITVNTPPTGDNNTVSTNEDVTYTFNVADFTVNYNDANGDPFDEIRVTSLESVGSLLLGGTPVALNDVITAAQIAANQLTFVPVADQFGSPYDSFDFEVGDGLNFSSSDYTLTINVTSVNDPPTGDGNTVSTNEDVTYVFAVADFTVNYSDPESDPFAEIRVTSLESVGSLLLGGTPVALNDVITAAQISGGQLTFVPVANQSGSPYDSFDFEVGDGSDFSTADYTLTVNVTPVNDPPTGDNNTVTTNEDVTYVFAVADFTVNYSDPESDPFAEIRVTSLESVGSLLLGGTPVALNDVITAAQIAANQLTFVPVAGQSGSPYDSFDFEVGDGSDFSTADYTLTVNVLPINDPPTGDDNTVTTNEDITYVFAVADFTVNYSDPESDPFAEIRVTSLESVGSLLLGGTPVALNDVITAAQIAANQLTFVPVANQSGSPYDSFDFEVGDGSNFSTADYTLTVNVTPVNDPPTGDDNTVSTNEDVTYVFAVADFTVNYSDPESDPFAEIRVTSLESVGSLLLGGTPVALNDVITAAQIAANQLTFVPVAGQSGSPYDSFDFEVGDGSDFSTADYTLTVNVTPVNDPPTGDDNTVTTNEDITYVFAVADFTVNYSDPESDPFAEIRVTSLESVGSLLLGGTPVALNDVITAAQIAANQLTFVPVANQSGSPYDSFDFEVGDGSNFSTADYTLTVNVTPVNDPPTGDNNTVTTNEDITYVFAVADFTVNYSDPESDPFAEIRVTSLESVGSLLLGGTPVALNDVITAAQISGGQLTFVPVAGQSGSPYDSFDFEVGDGSDFSTANYTLTVNVTPVNDPPTGDNNTVTTNEDITYVFAVADFTVNYADPESDPFAEIRVTSLESVGSLLLGGTPVALNDVITAAQISGGQLSFVPVAGQSGSPYDSFDFEVGDGSNFSTADYTLTVNVTPVNDPPTGDDNTVATNEDVTYVFAVADFTVNYADPESDPFAEIRVTSLESVGSLLLGGTPVALNDVITAAQIAANQLTFVPVANQSGSPYDSFDFEVGDGSNFSTADYTLTVNVTPVNDPPSGSDNSVLTQEDITYVFAVADFTVSYSDPDADPFAEIRITSLESVGSLFIGGIPVAVNDVITAAQLSGGQLTYVPLPGQSGSPYDSFDFEVGDGSAFSSTDYTLTVNVGPVNDPPTGDDNTVTTNEDITYVFAVADFTVNYSDPESDPMNSIRITSLESVGSLLFNGNPVIANQVITAIDIGNGLLTFVPVTGQNGSPYDSFEFEVGDAFAFSTSAYTLTVNVTPVNDPPTGDDNTVTTNEDITYVFAVADFTVNYSDPESDPFAEIRVTSLESVGSLLLGGTPVALNDVITAAQIAGGQLTFVPVTNQSGSPYDSFDFEVGDGSDFSTSANTLTVNVTPVNDSPVAVDDNVITAEETMVSIDVMANDDLGDEPTQISTVDGVTTQGGSAVINNNGTPADPSDDFIDYTPAAGYNGPDSFTYTIEDLDGETSTATVDVTVTPINDSPLAVDDNGNTNEDIFISIDVLINDNLGDTPTAISDVDNSTAQGGSAVINNNGTPADPSDDFIDYTPAPNFNGVDTFTYTIEDSDGETSTATVSITVTGVNDTPQAVDDNQATNEDTMVAIDVLANDNLGDEPTTIVSVDAASAEGGSVLINDNGTPADVSDDFVAYTPPNGFTGTDTFNYTIEDTDGETSSAIVTVTISLAPSTLVIYKGFSPNGDGSNDEWVIDGILFYPDNKVQVFNRWGNLVYKETGYDNQTKVWYGQSNEGWIVGDNILPDGTYFYMVDLGDGSDIHSGYVMLKR